MYIVWPTHLRLRVPLVQNNTEEWNATNASDRRSTSGGANTPSARSKMSKKKQEEMKKKEEEVCDIHINILIQSPLLAFFVSHVHVQEVL